MLTRQTTLLLFFTILYGNFLMPYLHEAHFYIISVSINKMLISQLKRFLFITYVFILIQCLILRLFLISML